MFHAAGDGYTESVDSTARDREPDRPREGMMPHDADSDACHYQIRIRERLDPRWVEWFEGLSLTCEPDGTRLLSGVVRDQAALYGLLIKARDLGLTLLAITRLEP
jgi:hypothetical protein